MHRFNFFILVAVILVFTSCEKIKKLVEVPVKLESQEQKVSYFLAYILTENTKKTQKDLLKKAFLQGVKDSLEAKEPQLNPEELQAIKMNFEKEAMLKKQQEEKEKNKMDEKTFLEENKNKQGVKVTESGLQYEVLKGVEKGKMPTATDTVEVHYRGTLIDGTEFDSSYKRNSSISFPLNGVIKGWTEGLQLMKEGEKYKFYIPSELAYGTAGSGESIPPNANLIFEVELLKVK